MQNSPNGAFLCRNWTNGGLFDSMLLQKMQGNAKNALILLLLGGPFFMGHPVEIINDEERSTTDIEVRPLSTGCWFVTMESQNDQFDMISEEIPKSGSDDLIGGEENFLPEPVAFNGPLNRRNTKNRPNNFQCPCCGKQFRAKWDLNRHKQLVHEKKKPFKCLLCDISFGMKDYLKKHIISIHTTERPFKCNICKKGYKKIGQLKQHTESSH